jgi:hypothetical protein
MHDLIAYQDTHIVGLVGSRFAEYHGAANITLHNNALVAGIKSIKDIGKQE